MSIDGANYLLPSDIPSADAGGEDLVKDSAIAEASVFERLKGSGVRVAVIVLDACRNNPFADGGTRDFGDATRGLTRPPTVQPKGIFGLYSAGFGERALDRLSDADPDPNSVFTRVLVPALKTPDLNLVQVAYEVNEEVAKLAESVGHEQNPAYYDKARALDIYLAGKAEERKIVVEPTPAADAAAGQPCARAETHFAVARELGTREALEDHLARFSGCEFAGLAQQMLAKPKEAAQENTAAVLNTAPNTTRAVRRTRIELIPEGIFSIDQDAFADFASGTGEVALSIRGGTSANPRVSIHSDDPHVMYKDEKGTYIEGNRVRRFHEKDFANSPIRFTNSGEGIIAVEIVLSGVPRIPPHKERQR